MSVKYVCLECGWSRPLSQAYHHCCPTCNGLLRIKYPQRGIENLATLAPGIWRYSQLLPDFRIKPSLGEGGTLLRKARRLGKRLGLRELYVKDETRNPTGAFTDRGAATVVASAIYYGFREITSFTGGNIAVSLTAYSIAHNMPITAVLDRNVDAGKLYQIVFLGGKVSLTPPMDAKGCVVTPSNPFLIEGYKTIAFELFEDLNDMDSIIIPVGHGSLLYSIWKGFAELKEGGLIKQLPRLIAVQPQNCATLLGALGVNSRRFDQKESSSVATELAVRRPVWLKMVLKALKDTGGDVLLVSDDEIVEGLKLLASHEGLLVETASATVVAALPKALKEGVIDRDEKLVMVATGVGLKDPRTVLRALVRARPLAREVFVERPKVSRLGVELLKHLRYDEIHGYSLWKKLLKEGYEVSLRAVYYHLRRLEEMGLVRKLSYRSRKSYIITPRGVSFLKSLELE